MHKRSEVVCMQSFIKIRYWCTDLILMTKLIAEVTQLSYSWYILDKISTSQEISLNLKKFKINLQFRNSWSLNKKICAHNLSELQWFVLTFWKWNWTKFFFSLESGRWSLVGSFRSESSHWRLLFKLTNFYLSTLEEREFFSSQLLVNSSAILDLHIKVIWFLHSYSQQFINCQKSRFSFILQLDFPTLDT